VLMAAGDTFRAAAAEQLELWAQRTGAELVRGDEGADPSAVIFDGVQRAAARSFDVGSRRVLDMFLHADPPTAEELRSAAAWVAEEMRPFFDALRGRTQMLVTLAGTGTTLSAVRQGLAVYDAAAVHGSCLSGGDVADLREELAAMPVAARREVVGMDPARADVIVAGAVILEAIMALSGVDSTVVSEHDILYGLVLSGA